MTYTVAIIGAGIGAQHMEGYAALPDRYRVKTICDLNVARADEVAGRFEGVGVTDSFAGVLADAEIDLVDICLPPHLHFRACMDALEAGKNVVCEKPLVMSLREVDVLSAKVRETGRILSPVFQYRYGVGVQQMRALIDSGLAGQCYAGSLETHWNRSASYYEIDWRGTWAGEQGGAILGHAVHIHDLLTAIVGPVSKVYADLATRVNEIETEDCASISLRMANGALVTSSVTLGSAFDSSRLRLMFEGFTVESDHAPYAPAARPWQFVARAPTTQRRLDEILSEVPDTMSSFAGMFEALADALDGRAGGEVTIGDGRRSVELVTAIYASARSGRPVSLPLGQEFELYGGWMPGSRNGGN